MTKNIFYFFILITLHSFNVIAQDSQKKVSTHGPYNDMIPCYKTDINGIKFFFDN